MSDWNLGLGLQLAGSWVFMGLEKERLSELFGSRESTHITKRCKDGRVKGLNCSLAGAEGSCCA